MPRCPCPSFLLSELPMARVSCRGIWQGAHCLPFVPSHLWAWLILSRRLAQPSFWIYGDSSFPINTVISVPGWAKMPMLLGQFLGITRSFFFSRFCHFIQTLPTKRCFPLGNCGHFLKPSLFGGLHCHSIRLLLQKSKLSGFMSFPLSQGSGVDAYCGI